MITHGNQSITSGQRRPTRERLLEAGLRLFADRGYEAVTVGEIEEAAGLVPRRGGMYRHFASKAALLEAAVEAHLASVGAARAHFSDPAAAGAPTARELGAWVLTEMDRQRDITLVLERDGARLSALRDRFRTEVSDASYVALAEIIAGWAAGRSGTTDPHATAVLLLGALVNVRRSTWTLGAAPLGLEEDRLVAAWADLCDAAPGPSA